MPNWYDEGKEVTIPLDLRFSPSQNAQNFFKTTEEQTAARMLVDLLAEGEKEIAYLETVLYEVETASGEAALNEIRAELKSQGYLKYYKQRDKRQKPADFLRFTSSDGFEILVGRNNVQNDKLTLHTARGKDLWFHVQKAPGSHCGTRRGHEPGRGHPRHHPAGGRRAGCRVFQHLQGRCRRQGGRGHHRGEEHLESQRRKARHGALRGVHHRLRHPERGAGEGTENKMTQGAPPGGCCI